MAGQPDRRPGRRLGGDDVTTPLLRVELTLDGDDIQGTIELPGDGVFTLECVSLIVRDLAKKTNVSALEVVQDLYSLMAIQLLRLPSA